MEGAHISNNGVYRYLLWRIFDSNLPLILFIMFNPSTANATEDDPTIRRLIGFTNKYGFGGFIVCNLYAFRSTNPRDIIRHSNYSIGQHNRQYIQRILDTQNIGMVVYAWGNNHPTPEWLTEMITNHNITPRSLRININGVPSHPLYLSYNSIPLPYYTNQQQNRLYTQLRNLHTQIIGNNDLYREVNTIDRYRIRL